MKEENEQENDGKKTLERWTRVKEKMKNKG